MVLTSTTANSLPNHISEEGTTIIALQVEESPQWTEEGCIYRVPKRLQKVNEDAYTPKLISIGPFYHGNAKLREMETLKSKYFLEFIYRIGTTQQAIIRIVANNEQAILYCYDRGSELTSEDFVRMVALDSIFIIEHFLRATARGENENNYTESKVSKPWLKGHIMLDLLLLENQLPFFILHKIYKKFFRPKNDDSFFNLACKYFLKYLFSKEKQRPIEKKVNHFTDLIRYIYNPSDQLTLGDAVSYVYNATKLYEAGVRFEKTEEGGFDKIKFKKWGPFGICQCLNWLLIFLPCLKSFPCLESMKSLLYLPSFVADKRTEYLLRNIMALEQCHYPLKAYLCNYMVLLDHLINTSEDVELLVDKGIIVNALGSYHEVVNMVNKIALEIVEENSCYGDVVEKLKNHYQKGCNRNIGYLKSTYFSNL